MMVEEVYRGSRIDEDVDFGVSNLYLCFRVVTGACVDSKKIFIVRFIEIRFVVCDASNFSFRLWWRFAIFNKMSHFLTIMALLPSSWTRSMPFLCGNLPHGCDRFETYDSCLEFHPEFLYLSWGICFLSYRKLRRRKSPISECVLIVYRCNLPYFRFVLCWRY